MGYQKVVQYGNIIEKYQYEKELNRKSKGISHVQALRLQGDNYYNPDNATLSVVQKRKKTRLQLAKEKGTYQRTKRSIKRSKLNFFRLVHHNNCLAKTIHFVTITFAYDISYKEASRHVRHFMERVKKDSPELSLSYISVTELTKKGRLHFHLLVYGLPPETAKKERKTRNFQRKFQRGYIDIMCARDASPKIAGYMAKYMAKSLGDSRYETRRGYTCSRNIAKITSYGSNSLSEYDDMIIPDDDVVKSEVLEYDTKYLGRCRFNKITKRL